MGQAAGLLLAELAPRHARELTRQARFALVSWARGTGMIYDGGLSPWAVPIVNQARLAGAAGLACGGAFSAASMLEMLVGPHRMVGGPHCGLPCCALPSGEPVIPSRFRALSPSLQWGNARYVMGEAFIAALLSKQLQRGAGAGPPTGTALEAACLARQWTRQVLGESGPSLVAGVGGGVFQVRRAVRHAGGEGCALRRCVCQPGACARLMCRAHASRV